MRKRTVLLGLVMVLAWVAVAAAAHHFNGTWELAVDLGGGQGGTATFKLEEKDGKLTGTYSGALGQHDVSGTTNGNNFEFWFESPDVGKVSYKGTYAEDGTISGECTYGQMGTGTFKGKKKET